jgi:5'-phosphate synthase pdxT subunit
MYENLTIGVLALQGDFERHKYRLDSLNVKNQEIRTEKDIDGLDGLIIPGGESTTMCDLIDRFNMRDKLADFCKNHPVWGTCAGMIILATDAGDNKIKPLSVIDISVIRNGYGRQIYSFYTELPAKLNGTTKKLKASFIRAPIVKRVGPDVEILARYDNMPVLLQSNKCLVSSFHTELDSDLALTKYFLDHIVRSR